MLVNGRRLGHHDATVLAIRDITEGRRSESRQRLLMAELQHRVKNILGNVRALALQTRRGSRGLDDFFGAFDSRLNALARAQELIVRGAADKVALRDIVLCELEAAGATAGPNVAVQGPAVGLSPHHAQAVAMTVHELATNAAKHGALAVDGAHVEIVWRLGPDDRHGPLFFEWHEHGVPVGRLDPPQGFGTNVIRHSLPHLLGGSAELVFTRDGVACRIEFPLAGAEENDHA
jgi:two-component system CheB/CheR fusion protein